MLESQRELFFSLAYLGKTMQLHTLLSSLKM